jgi:hypothetical protein
VITKICACFLAAATIGLAAFSSVPAKTDSRTGISVWLDTFESPRSPNSYVTLLIDAQVEQPMECQGDGIEYLQIDGDDGFWAYAYVNPPAGWVFSIVTDYYTPIHDPVPIEYNAFAAGYQCGWGWIDGWEDLTVNAEQEYPVSIGWVSDVPYETCGPNPPNCTEGGVRLTYEVRSNWSLMVGVDVIEEISDNGNACFYGEPGVPYSRTTDTNFQGRFDDVVYKCISGSSMDCCPGSANPQCLTSLVQIMSVGGTELRSNTINKFCTYIMFECNWGCY